MGRFCRQWRLKIRITCRTPVYWLETLLIWSMWQLCHNLCFLSFAFIIYLRVLLCFKTQGKEMPKLINQANNQLKSTRICNSAETQTSVMNKNYEISKGWQVYLMCLSLLLTCGFYFRVCLLGRDGGGGWPKHGGTGRFSFSSQEHCSSLLAS